MINFVLIGSGKIAENFHLPAIKRIKSIRLVAIIDKDILKAKRLAKKFKINNYSTTLEKVSKLIKIDAAVICVSNNAHEKIINQCLKKNLHFICEKPFVTNPKFINQIKKLSEKKKLICVSAQHQRYRLPSILLKKKISDKKLGKIYFININSLYRKSHVINNFNQTKRASYNGLLLDLGSHFFDLILWLLNNPEPYSVTAFASKTLSKNLIKKNKLTKKFEIFDFCTGLIKFKNNMCINFKFSYLLNSNINRKEEIKIFAENLNILWPQISSTKLNSKKMIKNSKKEIFLASHLMLKDFLFKIKQKKIDNNNLNIQMNSLRIIDNLTKSISKNRTIYFENK